jgi:ketosteroid isomerase-like protein
MKHNDETTDLIIGMERAALDRWGKGDPSGFLEITAEDVAYFDPFQERRIDGIRSLTNLYESILGAVQVDRYELIDPKVQLFEDAAVLTFNYVGHGSDGQISRWNCTEVYRRAGGAWKIVQTHWSSSKPPAEE